MIGEISRICGRNFSRMVFCKSSSFSINHQRSFAVTKSMAEQGKKLFTPGPLGTSRTVREAALPDLGSRDVVFIDKVKYLRSRLVQIAGVREEDYTTVPIQGSGTFAVEAVIQTAVPRTGGKVLLLENGAYGKRMAKICEYLGIPYHQESFPENQKVDLNRVADILRADNSFTLVSVVHCETSSGVINPVVEVGSVVRQILPDCVFFVDAMSSFGAIPLDMTAGSVDFMVSSANKCLQGIPGFSYSVARKTALEKCKGNSRSLSLDLYDQYQGLESTGQFRFTPATHTMLAFCQALKEFDEEGGLQGRSARYIENRRIIREGMRKLGFTEFLDSSHDGYIITSYNFPDHPNFDFKTFYSKLNEKDQVIYPGKVLNADCFRIGNIGDLYPKDMSHLLVCIEQVCEDMGIPLPLRS
ncbi:2-aminoethylphosphonate--pyruvate transaminase-like [Pecten maximus]|uniref:2-aminoethylphosphonate--pyruvate transaminase-like n=1 Tax=Pecten maximus TaxID=6579 RepID=UPI0014588D65|nr:2-aminoethylphosphonate--pyruvate transaminase-like [Pecten maximus]